MSEPIGERKTFSANQSFNIERGTVSQSPSFATYRKTYTPAPSFNVQNAEGIYYYGNVKECLLDGNHEKRSFVKKSFSQYTTEDVKQIATHAWIDTYVYFLLNWDHDYKYLVAFLFWYMIFFLFGAVGAFITYYYWLNILTYNVTAVLPPANSTNAITVLMIGDSLVRRPSAYFNLQGLLYDHLKPINATFINDGEDGQTISAISARLVPALELYNPQAVILYWDSDVSNIAEKDLTQQQVDDLRRNYRNNLTWFINTTLNYPSVEFMTVGGPELLGEGKLCLDAVKQGKTEMLNDYRAMNRNITAMMNVSYMDIRQEFLDNLPFYWPLGFYWLTVDGEHPNYRGAHIIAKTFADQLRPWINSRNSNAVTSAVTNNVAISSKEFEKRKRDVLWTPPGMPLQTIPKHYEKQDTVISSRKNLKRREFGNF